MYVCKQIFIDGSNSITKKGGHKFSSPLITIYIYISSRGGTKIKPFIFGKYRG